MASNISERRPLLHPNPNRNPRVVRRPLPQRSSSVSQPTTPDLTAYTGNLRQNACRTQAARGAILLSLVFERIAFYGLAGNLVLFLNKDPFKWESYHAIDASLIFFGLCFMLSLIGGWIADAMLGRFKTLLLSFAIYLAGYMFMPFLTTETPMMDSEATQSNLTLPSICRLAGNNGSSDGDSDIDPFDEPCAWLIYIVLTVIAIGTGSVKANIAPFGSDQVTRDGQQATLSFFNWFYWSINLGALVGLSVITYVQQQQSFFIGYIISVSCLGMSALLFLAGRCFYHVKPPDGSVLTNIFRIIREAFRRKRQRRQEITEARAARRRQVDRDLDDLYAPQDKISFLDYAKHRYGGVFHDSLVDDVKELKKIFAVFAVLIPYLMVYFQMETTFLVQGLHMRLMMPFHNSSLMTSQSKAQHPQLVAAWFSLFDVVMLIILLPLFDRVIYPWIERRTGRPVNISRRIIMGMVFATIGMIVAGVVEHFRLKAFWPYPDHKCVNASINQNIGGTQYQAANMSILWQIPQYALLGLSEVFTSVAGLQFAVSVAPRSMKGIIMGLFYLFSGIGGFLGTAIVTTLSSTNIWFHSRDYGNINCRICNDKQEVIKSCHLDYFFFLLAVVEIIGVFLFLLVSKVFQLNEHHRHSRSTADHNDIPEEYLDSVPSTVSQNSSPVGAPHTIQRYIALESSS